MNWLTLSSELLRELRGRRSQRQLSRRLGFESNVMYRWETGRSWPSAPDFFRLARLGKASLEASLQSAGFTRAVYLENGSLDDCGVVARWLSDIRGQLPIATLSQTLQTSRYVVSRWFSGTTQVRLPELLQLVEALTRRSLDFVALFVDPAKLPSVTSEWKALNASRDAAFRNPWSHAVLRVLELDQYTALPRHRRGFIAKQLGISLEEEQTCLRLLRDAGQIRMAQGRWVVDSMRTIDTTSSRRPGDDARGFWLQVAHQRWEQQHPGIYGYNICSLSDADYERLQALYRKFFEEMREIVANSTPNQCVALIATQMVRF